MNKSHISLNFIKELKSQILRSRYHVAKVANAESLRLYFIIGESLDNQFKQSEWGSKVLETISSQLQQEIPGLRGFSAPNMKKMRFFFQEWKELELIWSSVTTQEEIRQNTIGSSLTSQLEKSISKDDINSFLSISFTHHYEILTKVKDPDARWFYIKKTALELWSVRHLRIELKNLSHLQIERLPNNFKKALEPALSNKAIRVFKDQYLLDFVNVEDPDEELDEKVVEQEIVQNIKKFLMSLGSGFTFIGNQYRLIVNEEEYFIDLLFFHRGLKSLVAFELKKGKFKPEYVGKMNFYLSALDDLVKEPHENSSIGIILCKEKDDKKVEYSFRDLNKPMGVSIYKTSKTLPDKFKTALPTPEQLKKLLD